MTSEQQGGRNEPEGELFRLLVENVKDYAIFILDTQGRVQSWNSGAERLLGYREDEVIGKPVEIFFTPEDISSGVPRQELEAASQAGCANDDRWHVRKDGTRFWAGGMMSPLWDEARNLRGFAKIMRDRTEWKQAQDERERQTEVAERRRRLYEAALSNTPDLVYVFEQSQELLRHSEARYRGLMEQAPFSIQVFAPDGRTIRVNHAWEELWGVRFDQLGDYNILKDRQLEEKGIMPYILQGFAGQAARIPAIQYNPEETKPGVTQYEDPRRWLSAVIYPLKDAEGQVREVVLIHEDITARHRAEESLRESERLYRAIGESIDYGVWVCDPQGRNIYASESFLRLVGMTQEQCSSFGWVDVLHPDDAERTAAAWKECVRTGGQWDIEHRFRGVDGNWHPLLARGVPVRNDEGEITSWAGINLDISRQKRVEDQLRDADRRKDEFLATLAHELRNPLAPIRNSLQILKMPRIDEAIARQAREMMERQVEHLVRLVDDLLDVSRVMRGKIELRREPIELATVVARAVETVQPLIEVQGHQLDITLAPESLLLDGDPVRLTQAIGNLLTNAAKYTEANGHIQLTGGPEGGEAVLRIRDDGIGITADMLPHVFELFVQADYASTKAHGGLGIGLTLVKSLVEMHNGRVEAHSAGLGQGSEFVIRLPLLKPAPPEATTSDREQPHLKKSGTGRRLLVVDDNRDAANSLAMLLRLQGHEVRVVHDGKSALEIASSYIPELVFLDIGMPEMDGYEVARNLRRMPALETTVLAALTGWGQNEDRRRTAEAGFDHHLVKPAEPKVLERLLAELNDRRT